MEIASSIFNWDNTKVANLWPNFFRSNQKKVLVIEDDDEMGSVIKKSLRSRVSYLKFLSDHNFDFEYKEDPEEALNFFFEKDSVDLIIVDWNLKTMPANNLLKLFDNKVEQDLTAERMFKKTPVIILCPNNIQISDLSLNYFYLYKVVPREARPDQIIGALSSTVHSALTH